MPQVVDACVCKDAEKVVFEGRCVAKQDCGCYDASDGTEHRVICSFNLFFGFLIYTFMY